ncbi:hypothetical protein AYO43_00155 [Nitrospira sp. SCGC AG-212-E16]|nr:hypothetical protein AYO43_00155 [Nitrospira sp. SCGC AG-212-E16]
MGLLYAGLNRSPVGLQLQFRVLAGLCGVMMLMSGSLRGEAGAAEWSAAPALSVKGLYNSNLLLSNGNNEVWGQWVSPGVKFKGSTESLEVAGNVKSDFVQYYGSTDRSLTNLYFPLQASYRSDRNTFGFDGGFTRDNTLQGELLQTGLVLAFTQRNQLTAAPSWKFGITERLSWQSSYQYTNTQYEDGIRVGLVNYQVQAVNTGMTYNLGERDQLQLTGEYTSFRIPSRMQDSMYYGAQAGWTHDFGQEMTASISGGPRFVTSTQDVSGGSLSAHETVWVYRGTLRKSFERAAIQIDGSREINPSGIGRLVETNRAGVSLSHNLTETVTASLNGSLYFVSAVVTEGPSGSFPQSRFSSISPSVSWKFSQWWTLDVAYTYGERAVEDLNQWNFSNSTFVMLTYGGPKWSVSR